MSRVHTVESAKCEWLYEQVKPEMRLWRVGSVEHTVTQQVAMTALAMRNALIVDDEGEASEWIDAARGHAAEVGHWVNRVLQ